MPLCWARSGSCQAAVGMRESEAPVSGRRIKIENFAPWRMASSRQGKRLGRWLERIGPPCRHGDARTASSMSSWLWIVDSIVAPVNRNGALGHSFRPWLLSRLE